MNSPIYKGQLKTAQVSLPEVIAVIREFVMPPSLTAAQGEVFNKLWVPATYWSDIQSSETIEEK